MATAELIQVVGILLQAIFIPLLLWVGKVMVALHYDVQALVKWATKIDSRLEDNDELHQTHEGRILALEFTVSAMKQRVNQ